MKFSIRDLLWLTVVVALGLGWWRTTRMLQESQREHAKDVQDYKQDIAEEVQRSEALWQAANDPFHSPGDRFRGIQPLPRRRQFPTELP